MPARLFLSSGNLTADRRYDYARDLQLRGDEAAAADLFQQATELAPDFAAAWFALGECRERLNHHDEAIVAYRQAVAAGPGDRHGAGLRLMRLGAAPLAPMSEGYVRTLFEQYAPRFEQSLVGELHYRGPALLLSAVLKARPAARFARAIDLGCGTGLAGRAFQRQVAEMIGVDLAPGMVARAQETGCYAHLETGEMIAALRAQPADSLDLVLAADAAVYLSDLQPLLSESARVLRREGVLAFTVETHDGEGVVLGAGLRYAHAESYVRSTVAAAGLTLAHIDHSSARNEDHKPAPGLVIVAARDGASKKAETPKAKAPP